MCSFRICTSLPLRGTVLNLRCYTTLANQSHIQSFDRSPEFNGPDAQATQTLQEKKLYIRGKESFSPFNPQIEPTPDARSRPGRFKDTTLESTLKNVKQAGHEQNILDSSLATREELIKAALEDHDIELPKHVYKHVIAKLCDSGDVDKALFWHRKLVAKGDAPQSVQDVKKLRQMLIDRRDWAAALEVKKSVVLQDIDVGLSGLSSPQDKVDHKKALQSFVSKLDKRVGVVRFHPHMEDQTCARFFATTFFSVEFVMEGIALFGVTRLGSLSIQEIIKRTIRGRHCDSSIARQYFTRMHKLGIECGTRYGRLLEYLAIQGKEVMLYSTVTSDFHPDMYNDLQLQESLLQSQDMTIVERTRLCLSFEMGEKEVEIRNLLLRGGSEDIERMVADGVPILSETRAVLLESIYIDRMPWISETRLRVLARVFLRLPHVTAQEWRHIVVCFMYIMRPHLRRDLESLLLSIRSPEVFDTRLISDLIRWYLRLGSLGRRHSIETMLGGIRVLTALRDQGIALEIQRSCEANLMSLFGDTPIPEKIDMRKRAVAKSLGTMEDFIIAIKDIWGPGLWLGLSPSQVKDRIFATAEKLRLRRNPTSGIFTGAQSHTGSYNPGKVRHLQKQISRAFDPIKKSSAG